MSLIEEDTSMSLKPRIKISKEQKKKLFENKSEAKKESDEIKKLRESLAELVAEEEPEKQTDPEKIKDVLKWFGPMNLILFLVYSILLLVAFIWFKPWFIYEYPSAEVKTQCVLQYCIGQRCYDMTGQEVNDSIVEGMRKLNWWKAILYYFGILIALIITHFFIAQVGILNIGTNSGRCGYKPFYC